VARIPAAVAAVRLAVRRALPPGGGPVLVACSGGADSLALAAAARFVGSSVGLVTVDHGMQAGSETRAADVASWAEGEGFAPVVVETVSVAGRPGGPEAAARAARYAALSGAAERVGAATVLLGHTRDDQAETVLLALARGAGPRGLAGMPVRKGVFVRPLLDVSRAETREACAALKLVPWDDPHNVDPAYARSRVRGSVMPTLVAALGPAVVANLARSAGQIGADNAVMESLASAAFAQAARGEALDISDLFEMMPGIRARVLHLWCQRLGAGGADLSHRHVVALDALITQWHGQGAVHLPGGILVARRQGALVRVSA
jgi:tRNA(Ile)-lysidine synthase